MRTILMDWLHEVAEHYKLSVETLWLAVALVDRSLACFYGTEGGNFTIGGELKVQKDKIQLYNVFSTDW